MTSLQMSLEELRAFQTERSHTNKVNGRLRAQEWYITTTKGVFLASEKGLR